ncbi:histidine phosphotransferase family protein, partial [Pseudomonadota bacterium]
LWDPDGAPGRIDLVAGKLLLNMSLIASEALPRGGVVEATLADYDGQLGLALAARGVGARLSDELRAAISADVDVETLTPRTVHGHFCAVLAKALGAELEISLGEGDEIHLAALLPRV